MTTEVTHTTRPGDSTEGASALRSRVSAADFDRDGFVHLRGCVDAQRVTELRASLSRLFDQPSNFTGDIKGVPYIEAVYFDPFNRYEDLAWVPFHPPIVAALRTLLGPDFVYLPEFAIHDRGYGSWHKDTTSQQTAGHQFHWQPDFKMVQVGLYLQGNHPEYAGGLDVIVGSHTRRDRVAEHSNPSFVDRKVRSVIYRATKLRNDLTKRSLRSEAGDVVVFHLRLDHKATTPKKPVPTSHRKLAAFAVASENNQHARAYLDFIKARPDYVYLRDYAYAPGFRDRALAAGVNLLAP